MHKTHKTDFARQTKERGKLKTEILRSFVFLSWTNSKINTWTADGLQRCRKNAIGGCDKLNPAKIAAKNKYYKILNKFEKNIESLINAPYNCKKIHSV